MNPEPLFDEPKFEYRLFDAMRLRFVPGMTGRYTSAEAAERNINFEKSRCGHLEWKTEKEIPARRYTGKRWITDESFY